MTTLEEMRELLRDGVMAPQREEPEPEEPEAHEPEPEALRLHTRQLASWQRARDSWMFGATVHEVREWNLYERKTLFIDDVEYGIQKIYAAHWQSGKQIVLVNVAEL